MADVEITSSQSHVRVRPGDELTVRLPENATTGYRWDVTRLDPQLMLVSDEYEVGGIGMGAGGVRTIKLQATGPGDADVELQLKRPWEATAKQNFVFHAEVSG